MKKSSKVRRKNNYLLRFSILSLLLNVLLLSLFIKSIFSIVSPEDSRIKVCKSDVDFFSVAESEQVLESMKSENYLAILWYDLNASHTLRITTYNSSDEVVCYSTSIKKEDENYFKSALSTNSVELTNSKISFNNQNFSSDIPEDEWNSSLRDILVAWANK